MPRLLEELGHRLTFVEEPNLEDAAVVLFYDDDPDGGGEVPEDDTELQARPLGRAATASSNSADARCRPGDAAGWVARTRLSARLADRA